MKEGKGIFHNQLRKSVLKKIIVLLSVGAALFILGQLVITFTVNEGNARNNLSMLEEVYLTLYERNHMFLEEETVYQQCLDILYQEEKDIQTELLEQLLYRFNAQGDVGSEMILCNEQGEILYSSFSDKELTSYLINYNGAVCFNVENSGSKDVYHAVYYDTGSYADYMFVKPLYVGGELGGYVTLFLSGDEWNFYLSDRNFDGVITDMRANVIYCSKAKLADKVNKFYQPSGRLTIYHGERYWTLSKTLPDYKVVIYSLVYYPQNTAFLIGLLIIVIMSFCWYLIANWMAASMADNNSERIGRLVKEIRLIRKGDINHRVEMGTKDEFQEVGYQINYMLNNIQALNNKNTELLQLNNAIEINQLTAQMNPHFLYNTLEIIRNLVVQDSEKADELIILLTQLLRYSINHQAKDVYLEEDMRYIQAYLDIQRCRFGERFTYRIHMEAACGQCMLPKLLLQPLIENCIKYGFKKQMNIHVAINGWMRDSQLMLSVADDGPGMEAAVIMELNGLLNRPVNDTGSFGLYSISRRLYLQYGEQSGLEVKAVKEKGLEVIVTIKQKDKGGDNVSGFDY